MRPNAYRCKLDSPPPPGINYSPCTGNLDCHVEYCFTATGTCSGWFNSLPAQINLPSSDGDGAYTVQSQYRLAFGGYYYPSPPGSFPITLILPNTPNVSLNSPAGILDPSGATLLQSQNINGTVGQWVTYTASSSVGAQLNITADGGCGAPCGPLLGGVASGPPFMWSWTGSAQPPADTYVTVTATDDAGNTNTTVPVSTSAFSLFTPGSSGIGLTCNGSTGNCVTLADQADNDIPGDSPSPSVGGCSDSSIIFEFSGYGDLAHQRYEVHLPTDLQRGPRREPARANGMVDLLLLP